jgi:aspartate racemase
MNTPQRKTVGILGGMGPAATVDLMQRIIAATPASDDADHIHMLVDNNPRVPSRIKALVEKTGPSPLPVLVTMAQKLRDQGADFLAIPCNTAHHYYHELASAVDIPLLNVMNLVAKHIAKHQPAAQCIGLLASSALSQIRLYEPAIEREGMQLLYPGTAQQTALMQLILAVKGNSTDAMGYAALQTAADDLAERGVDCLVIACTELSVIANRLITSLPVYDAADVLTRAVICNALGET